VPELRQRPDCVNTAEKAAHPLQRQAFAQFGGPAAAPRIDGESKGAERLQCAAGERDRGDDGNFARRELCNERMLFVDCCIRPARRTVELRHDRMGVLDAYLVDTILVASKRNQPAVAAQPDAIKRIQHAVGGQLRIRMRRCIHPRIVRFAATRDRWGRLGACR
jgi:hypothetical protein